MEGHPDNVGPALLGGLIVAVATASLPIVTQVEVPPLQVVIVTPDLRVATDEARRILPPMLSRHDAIYNIGRAALVVQALSKGDFDLLGRAMDDRLHQPYRKHLIKGYDDVVSAAKEAGASAVAISGSGPTLIAFAPDRHTGHRPRNAAGLCRARDQLARVGAGGRSVGGEARLRYELLESAVQVHLIP